MFDRRICVPNTFIIWESQSWLWTTVEENWCVWVSFWHEIGQVFDRTIFFFRIWNHLQSFFFLFGASVLSIPPCHFLLFCFMQKCGGHGSFIIFIDQEWIHFQLLIEFQSPGNKLKTYYKPNSKGHYDRIFTPHRYADFFFITLRNYIFVFNWFCQPLFQIFLQFAIKDCIVPFKFPSPNNI